MGLDFAIDELYATGWQPMTTEGCLRHSDGRSYPSLDRVRRECREAGFDLSLRHVQLFDCYRAEWRDDGGQPAGAVVGRSDAEAAVYALSQLRRQRHAVAVQPLVATVTGTGRGSAFGLGTMANV